MAVVAVYGHPPDVQTFVCSAISNASSTSIEVAEANVLNAQLVVRLIVVDGEVDCGCVVVDRIVVHHDQVIPAQSGILCHIMTTVNRTTFRFVVKF